MLNHLTSTSPPGDTNAHLTGARLTMILAITLVGLSAGFFVAYISSVTRGLADVSDVTYVETFKALNESVRNPLFALIFFGSVPALIVALAVNWSTATTPRRVLMAAALPLYLAVIAITGTGNVPLNNELADVVVTSPADATAARANFEDDWNRSNLARTIAVVCSFAALASAAVLSDD